MFSVLSLIKAICCIPYCRRSQKILALREGNEVRSLSLFLLLIAQSRIFVFLVLRGISRLSRLVLNGLTWVNVLPRLLGRRFAFRVNQVLVCFAPGSVVLLFGAAAAL